MEMSQQRFGVTETTDSWQKGNAIGRKSCHDNFSQLHRSCSSSQRSTASPCEMNCYSSPAGKKLKLREAGFIQDHPVICRRERAQYWAC